MREAVNLVAAISFTHSLALIAFVASVPGGFKLLYETSLKALVVTTILYMLLLHHLSGLSRGLEPLNALTERLSKAIPLTALTLGIAAPAHALACLWHLPRLLERLCNEASICIDYEPVDHRILLLVSAFWFITQPYIMTRFYRDYVKVIEELKRASTQATLHLV